MATRRGPDGTARVAIQGTHNGVNWANVFWFNLSGGATAPQADLDAWLASIAGTYETWFLPNMMPSVATVLAKATLFQTGGTVLQSQSARTGVGSSGGTEVAENGVGPVLSWTSPVYWRGGKPRTYIPSLATVNVTSGRLLTAGAKTALASNANSMHTAFNAVTHGAITATTHGFVSFRSGLADRVPPVFFSITGATVHSRVGSQRRRLGKWAI